MQSIAKKCEFGIFLDKALRDRFVAGLTNSHIQEKLLNKDAKLKFEEAVKEAATHETSKEEVKQFHARVNNGVVNKMSTSNNFVARKDVKQNHFANQNQRREQQYTHNYQFPSNRVSRDKNYNDRENLNRNNRDKYQSLNHNINSGRYANYICDNCNKRDHIKKFCKIPRKNYHVKAIEPVEDFDEVDVFSESVFVKEGYGLNMKTIRESINSINNPIYRDF